MAGASVQRDRSFLAVNVGKCIVLAQALGQSGQQFPVLVVEQCEFQG